ncbi:MAG: phage tail protein [Limibaculum sp.]
MAEPVRDTAAPFLRLNAATGWRLGPAVAREGIARTDGPLYLGVLGESPIPMTERFGSFGGRTTPRALAISGAGRIFLADPERREILSALVDAADRPRPDGAPAIWPFAPLWPARLLPGPPEPHDLGSAQLPPADPYTLVRPTDVALAPNGDLVVADRGAGRLLVMAFPTAHLRHVITLEGWAPTAVCFDAQGRAYVADPGLGTVHRFDSFWRRDSDFPHRSAVFSAPEHIAAAADACDCSGACECGGGTVRRPAIVAYVIDGDRVLSLRADGRTAAVASADDLALTPEALTLMPGHTLLYRDPTRPAHDQIRIAGLAITRDGRHEGSNRPLLAMPRRVRTPRFGRFLTDALDGDRAGFAWDRIALRASLPENTRLLIQTLTSDSRVEPDRVAAMPSESWSRPIEIAPADMPELLVQSPPGRYLWIRVELFGDGRASPQIEEIDVYGPRRSALSHLPAPFHQDPESVRFLDRFLHYFDIVFEEITARNRSIAQLFDPIATPEGAFLDWLGAWFDLEFLAEWPTETRRRMIAEAIPYYRQRGTVAGLRRLLQWHTGLADPMPQVIEHFRLPEGSGPIMIGGRALEPGTLAHSFTVVLPAAALAAAEDEDRVRRLIAANVPAHTRFQLRLIQPGVAIGTQSTIGVDTLIGSLDAAALGTGRLGHDFGSAGPAPAAPLMLSSSPQQWSLPC